MENKFPGRYWVGIGVGPSQVSIMIKDRLILVRFFSLKSPFLMIKIVF